MDILTADEEREWFLSLGKTTKQRRAMVTELLDHAYEDGMTPYDKGVCARWLWLTGKPYRQQEAA